MIFETYDESLFISRFEDYKRVETTENPNGNFSYKGLRVLFEYLDNLSEDTLKDIELDVIALCVDYSEYKDLNEYLREYSNQHEEKKETEREEEFKARIEEEINDKTTLIKFGDDLNEGFIIGIY
jgi:hypothetical protein